MDSEKKLSKNKIQIFKKTYVPIYCVVLLILVACFVLWFNDLNSSQADLAISASVRFEGDYRIGEGDWLPIVDGGHISSTSGGVTLKGRFYFVLDGERVNDFAGRVMVAFYTNHIGLSIHEEGMDPFVLESEHEWFGDSACGMSWAACEVMVGGAEPLEIHINNPHGFGNENAVDELLSGFAIWDNMEFEKDVLDKGAVQRNLGISIMIVSLLFLGTALFSTLIHIKNSKIIWLIGLLVLCAGLYLSYSAVGVSFWSESIVLNTMVLGFSMMFYMLFLSMLITFILKKTKIIGRITVYAMMAIDAVLFVLPLMTDILFYDLWAWWTVIQLVANAVLIYCLIAEMVASKEKSKWFYIVAFLPLTAFAVDALGTLIGTWMGGMISQVVFSALLVLAIVLVLRLIPKNINAAAKAKELEMERIVLNAELSQSRISTMMSQIRPHFIYNTLGSVEQLCDIDPKKAGELVHDFAKYLRGNFGELDNPKPILMSKEMEHVRHYVSIENVRFPDMTFTFEMNSDDFHIPALTIQPVVENAIKHGLMKLQKGGTINVVSFETDTHYCVSVEDDGVGFDTTIMHDERKHVGLRNIRERLKAMVDGTLEIESTVGVGTKALIKIPKEARK